MTATAGPAQAATAKQPIAISIGDSFISGEGGKYAGNIYDSRESDGAQDKGPHNMGDNTYQDAWGGRDFKILGPPINDTSQRCHRADSAEIQSTRRAFGWTPVNLACSGAESPHVSDKMYHAEKAQVKQLADLANDSKYEIKAIVVSIGGNDLGFSDLMADLIQITDTNNPDKQSLMNKINPFVKKKTVWGGYAESIPDVKKKITNALDKISETMRKAGYADGSYRFVYQSYSNLFAGSDNRYMAEDNKSQLGRLESPGVPLSTYTVDYSRSVMVPALTTMIYEAMQNASNKHIQYMDLTNAFNGHELSSKDTEQVLSKDGRAPSPNTAEWVVAINSNFIAGSLAKTSRHFESFHPNRFGQEAYGTCLTATLKSNAREQVCVGQPGKPPSELRISAKGGELSFAKQQNGANVPAQAGNRDNEAAAKVAIPKQVSLEVPGEPQIAKLDSGDESLEITMVAPKEDGGSMITGIEYSTNGGNSWTGVSKASNTMTAATEAAKAPMVVKQERPARESSVKENSNKESSNVGGSPKESPKEEPAKEKSNKDTQETKEPSSKNSSDSELVGVR